MRGTKENTIETRWKLSMPRCQTISNLRAGITERKTSESIYNQPNFQTIVVNCRRSLNVKLLPRQCGQENLATDVHCTVHFNHPLPSTLFSPHSCGRVACQEDNTMTESEVRGVRGQRGTARGGEEVNGVLPARSSRFIRSAGWAADKTNPETAAPARRFGAQTRNGLAPLSTLCLAQGQRGGYEKQNCQQNDHNSTVIQIPFSGCSELIYCAKSSAPSQSALLRWHLSLHFHSSTLPPRCHQHSWFPFAHLLRNTQCIWFILEIDIFRWP